MRNTSSLALVVCALVAPAVAQEAPTPSPKLAAFEPMVGTWSGKGTVVPQEGMPAEQWTATIEVKPILGGFFFQEDTVVDTGGPTPLMMRSVYGWDAENERYVAVGCGNAGSPNVVATAHFPSPGTMVTGFNDEQNGQAVVARNIWKFSKDSLTYESQRANDAGDWYTEVEGSFGRTDAKPKGLVDASFMEIPVAPPMGTLIAKMAGTYDVTGTMTMAPGMPEMKIRGTETVRTMLGGHVLFSEVNGYADNDDELYVGQNYLSWNPVDNCFDLVFISNMGEFGEARSRMDGDDTLVTIGSGPMMGQLTAHRSIIRFGAHGIEEVTSHLIAGTNDPIQNFHAKYVRKDL